MTTGPYRLVFDVEDPAIHASIVKCEADLFAAFFDNTAEELDQAYGAYPGVHWVAVLDGRDEAVAAARVFLPTGQRSKTMDDVEGPPWLADPERSFREAGLDPALTADMATFAARPGLRKSGIEVTDALVYGVFAMVRANRCSALTLILDAVPDNILKASGLVFRTLPGTSVQPYFGSAGSRPAYVHVDEMFDAQRRTHPDRYRVHGLGLGVHGVAVPSLSAFEVPGWGEGRELA